MTPPNRLAWAAFGGLSLASVALGCWVARAHGVPEHVWLLNLAAWAVGAGLAFAVSRIGNARWWPVLASIGLASTFLSAGMSGVHRWFGIGSVRLNAAELLLPPALVARRDILLPAAILILLALQPDASQAIAFACGSSVAMAACDIPRARRVRAIVLFAAIAALSLLRHDPLAPVPEVEGIIGLAAALSPAIAALAVLALAGTAAAPLLAARSPAAYGLTAYLTLCMLAPVFGAFPVPLVGMGIGPILGAWLGFGALMAPRPARPSPQRLQPQRPRALSGSGRAG